MPFPNNIASRRKYLRGSGTERIGGHKYHNPPSGVREPSQADGLITARLKEALALIDVRLLSGLGSVTIAVKLFKMLGFRRTNHQETIRSVPAASSGACRAMIPIDAGRGV